MSIYNNIVEMTMNNFREVNDNKEIDKFLSELKQVSNYLYIYI